VYDDTAYRSVQVLNMKEKETECQTFKLITRAGLTKLKRCPYDEGCDGQRCPLLEKEERLNLVEDEDNEQERDIFNWLLKKDNRFN